MALENKIGSKINTWKEGSSVKTITFIVTEECNLACKYCYLPGKNNKKKLNFDIAKKAIDYILTERDFFYEKSVIWEFTGGEPFLEIDLIDKICDYIKKQTYILNHPWFDDYRFSFSTNGLLYGSQKVQNFIGKNYTHLSIGISVDGNKEKHDDQRIKVDGSGSYDDIMKILPLWQKQFPDASTKATLSHNCLPKIKDSVINLWNLGIKNVFMNVVFENVWNEGDDVIIEDQMKALADHIIENKIWDKYICSLFNTTIGKPNNINENKNWCGSGKMMAIDCDGNFYPCNRFVDFSLNKHKPRIIGSYLQGISFNKLRPFLVLNMTDQSCDECIGCNIATGCSWCTGFNYDDSESGTIYYRSTYICKMHKARVRAARYYEDKLKEVNDKKNAV
jgi:radical SAM peptide maturase (CXXX-repeat target family)